MTIEKSRSLRFVVAGMMAGTALCAVGARAQDISTAGAAISTDGSQGGEIVVTASKRTSSTIQDTPIAVQALGGDALKAQGAIDFADFYHAIPALSVQDEGPGDKRYVIRGINSAGASTVGLYLDETVITGENSQDGGGQAPDIKLFDIDRVEVLKGPQGTTFGASSMAGTIRYITKKADPDAGVNGYVQSALRATKGASLGLQTDGAVNLPIIPGVLAVRASGFYADLPGWIDNRFKNGANAEKSKAGRVTARLQATPDLTVDLTAMYQDVHQDAKNFYNRLDYRGNVLPSDFQADEVRAPYNDESEIYNATVNYKQPFGTFTGTVSRFVRDTSFVRDASLAAQAFFGLPYAATGRSALKQDKHRRVDSGELRFASNFGGPIQILVGGFFQNENRDFRSSWPLADTTGNLPANAALLLDREVTTRIKERALFGEVSYEIVPDLTFTVGGRLFDFKLEQVSNAIVRAGGAPGAGVGPKLRTKDDGLIGRFNLAYKLSDQVNTYVQVAQGYRSGGTNDQTAAAIANVIIPDGYGSDSLWSYEVGVKTTLMDRKLFLNGALYYIDWSDIQVSQQATNGTLSFGYTGNGGKAEVKGVEVTLEARPAQGLTINLSGNYNTAKLAQDNPIPATGRDGDRIPYVPKVTASGSVNYTTFVDALGVNASFGADVSHQGSMATKFNRTIANYQPLDSYWLVGLRVGVNNGPWAVNLNVTNLFDDRSTINYNEIVPGVYPLGYYTNRPRTFSLSGQVKF
ncbi:TonB-dependent receptor [uncultured Novosphingobium sp.]|uniref:TonB-dependent receptor n=1 Tax=uncultured Novosphingobium sp. TaxID=292277 RepID=UPI00258CE83A|nr:TonB-dependent receptor [uncultured Novosphingobium sp.]